MTDELCDTCGHPYRKHKPRCETWTAPLNTPNPELDQQCECTRYRRPPR